MYVYGLWNCIAHIMMLHSEKVYCIWIMLHFGLYLDGKANTIACVYVSFCHWEILRLNPDKVAAIQKIYFGWKELLSSFSPVDQSGSSQSWVLVSSWIQNWAFSALYKTFLATLWLLVRVWLHVSWMHHASIFPTLLCHFTLNVCVTVYWSPIQGVLPPHFKYSHDRLWIPQTLSSFIFRCKWTEAVTVIYILG